MLNPLVMLLPTALATNEIVPSNLRALGMLPLLIFLPALGIEWLTAKAATPIQNLQIQIQSVLCSSSCRRS
ncbi:MAG: hypothetical protein IPL28_01410 [Chloroflexi bacterium]|nr:hypothetical protein [Chloroflexota bacterium]